MLIKNQYNCVMSNALMIKLSNQTNGLQSFESFVNFTTLNRHFLKNHFYKNIFSRHDATHKFLRYFEITVGRIDYKTSFVVTHNKIQLL